MNTFFFTLFLVLIGQRLIEMSLAKRNAQALTEKGGYEVGESHYKFIILIHICFFISLLVEVLLCDKTIPSYWLAPFIVFLVAQFIRYWCITTLGPFWNTRIMILPSGERISKGPYRFFNHPNYLAVLIEILSFPLIFGAYRTAIFWTLINAAFLRFIRIPVEERALHEVYQKKGES